MVVACGSLVVELSRATGRRFFVLNPKLHPRQRQAAAAADEEGRQALESLGAARKHRELLLQEIDKARAEVERLGEKKASLVCGYVRAGG